MLSFWKRRSSKKPDFLAVSMGLKPGERMDAGKLTIEATRDGQLLIGLGSDFTAVVTPPEGSIKDFGLTCYTYGRALPQKHGPACGYPLCLFGPGGQYQRPYTPSDKKPSGASAGAPEGEGAITGGTA